MRESAVRITLVVHALDRNPIVRAAPIACALQKLGFDIEITGVLDATRGIYGPYRNLFAFRPVSSIREVADQIRGDAIYSFKPLPTTLLPAMLSSRFARDRPVLLDIEDDDYGVCGRSHWRRCLKGIRDLGRPPAGHLNSVTHAMRRCADAITVSTSMLQQFYGGSRLLHGPDEVTFDPASIGVSREACRRQFDLPSQPMLVLFAGRASEHKGFADIVEAVARTTCLMVLAGDRSDPLFCDAAARLGDRCRLIGMVDNEQMPRLLHAVDVVPVPLHDVPFARTQLPAKLLEAMAMEKSVVVSSVGDLADIVAPAADSERGWVVPPGDALSLAAAFNEIASRSDLRLRRGRAARRFFVNHASVTANAAALRSLFLNTTRLRPLIERAERNPANTSLVIAPRDASSAARTQGMLA